MPLEPLSPSLKTLVDLLLQRPLGEPAALQSQVQGHLDALAEAKQQGRLVDLDIAGQAGRLCLGLLAGWASHTDEERALIQAACLYFVEDEDEEDDLRPGGFADDLEVARWVAYTLSAARRH